MAPADDVPPSTQSVDVSADWVDEPLSPHPEPGVDVRGANGLDEDEARRLRTARRHDLGRPAVTEHEIGQLRFLVAEVEPLDVDGVRTMQVGSALWFLAFVALLPFLDTLRATGREWWLATCLAGAALGLIGWEYCRRRRTALLADPRRRRTDTSDLGPLG